MSRVNIENENLALPIDIEGGDWNRFFVRLSLCLSAVFSCFILIAAFAPLHEVAIAEGKIVPLGSVIRVEHYEGGIVKEINYSPGDKVTKGDVLVLLTPNAAESDQEQLRARWANLQITKIRLESLLNDKQPDFGDYAKTHPKLVLDHMSMFREERDGSRHTVAILESRARQKMAEIRAMELETKSIESQLEIYREQYNLRKSLVKDGFTTRNSYLEAKARVAQAEAQIAQAKGQLIANANSLTEVRRQLEEAVSKARQKWSTELTQTTATLNEINAALSKTLDRVNRLAVRAPIDGVVQNINPKAIGEVINPGDLVAELVPEGDELVAEVRLKPEDIANINPGQQARVTITAFDTKEFGTIDGKVRSISPTTFTNDKDEQYYEVKIALLKHSLSRKGVVHPVLPGMVVSSELVKGDRTVLRYMLKPIYTAIDNSFGER